MALSAKETCPNCRQNVNPGDVLPSKHSGWMVKRLKRKCRFCNEGCMWTSTITELDAITDHENTCRYVKIQKKSLSKI